MRLVRDRDHRREIHHSAPGDNLIECITDYIVRLLVIWEHVKKKKKKREKKRVQFSQTTCPGWPLTLLNETKRAFIVRERERSNRRVQHGLKHKNSYKKKLEECLEWNNVQEGALLPPIPLFTHHQSRRWNHHHQTTIFDIPWITVNIAVTLYEMQVYFCCHVIHLVLLYSVVDLHKKLGNFLVTTWV